MDVRQPLLALYRSDYLIYPRPERGALLYDRKEKGVKTLTKTILDVDWNDVYSRLESKFYPYRKDKTETFPQWLRNHTRIEYFEPSISIRTGPVYSSCCNWTDGEGYVYWFWLLSNGEIGDSDGEYWDDPFGHITSEDWEKRETNLDHY